MGFAVSSVQSSPSFRGDWNFSTSSPKGIYGDWGFSCRGQDIDMDGLWLGFGN